MPSPRRPPIQRRLSMREMGNIEEGFRNMEARLAARRLVVVGTGGHVAIASEGTTAIRVESQKRWRIGPAAVSGLRLAFGSFKAVSNGDQAIDQDFDIEAAILKWTPSSNTGVALPCTFGGRKVPTVDPGASVVLTDPINMRIDAGGYLITRQGALIASGEKAPGGMRIKNTNDKTATMPSGSTSQVYSNTSWSTTGGAASTAGAGFQPVCLLGIPETPIRSFAFVGDSIMEGATGEGATGDGAGYIGWAERGAALVYPDGAGGYYPAPFVNLSLSGDKFTAADPSQMYLRTAYYDFVTDVIFGYGTNDIALPTAIDTIKTNARKAWAAARARGCYVHQAAVGPKATNSGNSAVATDFGPGGVVDQLNDWFAEEAASGRYLDGFIDHRPVLRDPATGLWLDSAYTSDGLHLTAAGAAAAAAIMSAYMADLPLAA